MSVYLDASVIVPILAVEAESQNVRDYLRSLASPPIVSEFASGEVASAMSRSVRTGELAEPLAVHLLRSLDLWRAASCKTLVIEDADIVCATGLVRQLPLKLRMPDALHAALCLRHGHTLATFDTRLAAAAAALGIAVDVPRQSGMARWTGPRQPADI